MLPDDRKNNSPYFIGNIMEGITESLKSLSLFYGKRDDGNGLASYLHCKILDYIINM